MTIASGIAKCPRPMRRRWNAPTNSVQPQQDFTWTMPPIEAVIVREAVETLIHVSRFGVTNSICHVSLARVRWLERPMPI